MNISRTNNIVYRNIFVGKDWFPRFLMSNLYPYNSIFLMGLKTASKDFKGNIKYCYVTNIY